MFVDIITLIVLQIKGDYLSTCSDFVDIFMKSTSCYQWIGGRMESFTQF